MIDERNLLQRQRCVICKQCVSNINLPFTSVQEGNKEEHGAGRTNVAIMKYLHVETGEQKANRYEAAITEKSDKSAESSNAVVISKVVGAAYRDPQNGKTSTKGIIDKASLLGDSVTQITDWNDEPTVKKLMELNRCKLNLLLKNHHCTEMKLDEQRKISTSLVPHHKRSDETSHERLSSSLAGENQKVCCKLLASRLPSSPNDPIAATFGKIIDPNYRNVCWETVCKFRLGKKTLTPKERASTKEIFVQRVHKDPEVLLIQELFSPSETAFLRSTISQISTTGNLTGTTKENSSTVHLWNNTVSTFYVRISHTPRLYGHTSAYL